MDKVSIGLALMTDSEARIATDTVAEGIGRWHKYTAELREQLAEIKDREGWRALKYRSWDKYIVMEFPGMSRQYSYQLLDAGRRQLKSGEPTAVKKATRARASEKVSDGLTLDSNGDADIIAGVRGQASYQGRGAVTRVARGEPAFADDIYPEVEDEPDHICTCRTCGRTWVAALA